MRASVYYHSVTRVVQRTPGRRKTYKLSWRRGRSALGRPRERTWLSRPTPASAGERDRCAREEGDPAEPQTRAAGRPRRVSRAASAAAPRGPARFRLDLAPAPGAARTGAAAAVPEACTGRTARARGRASHACRARRSSTTREERRPAPRTGRPDPRSARGTGREAAAARAPRAPR